ncbi:MAG: hypothetical protein IK073_03725 [Paludibacteraceae bacterium]|nr:hypothetical protein [Paludibacteraceae bacterium]
MSDIFKRWLFMFVAIAAAMTLRYVPVFEFQGDKGIVSNRTYEMDQKNFYAWQTDFETNERVLVGVVSVKGLYYTNLAMIALSVLCLLCFFSDRWRIWLSLVTVLVAGSYYAFMIFYAVKISNEWFPTLYPNLAAILPAVVIEAMVLTRKSLLREIRHSDEKLDD